MEGDESCGYYDEDGFWIEYDMNDHYDDYTMEDWIADNCMKSDDPMCEALMNFPEW